MWVLLTQKQRKNIYIITHQQTLTVYTTAFGQLYAVHKQKNKAVTQNMNAINVFCYLY